MLNVLLSITGIQGSMVERKYIENIEQLWSWDCDFSLLILGFASCCGRIAFSNSDGRRKQCSFVKLWITVREH